MTASENPWSRPHSRLDHVVPRGLTRPNTAKRIARNAYWHIARPGGIDPVGWGDLDLDDLERIANVLHPNEVFLPVREHAGLLDTRDRPDGFDWTLDPSPITEPDVFAEAVTWVVIDRRCVRITVDDDPTVDTMTPPELAAHLARLIAQRPPQ